MTHDPPGRAPSRRGRAGRGGRPPGRRPPRRRHPPTWSSTTGTCSTATPRAPCRPGWRGGVLVPWPNRVRDGRWTWHGARAPARRRLADAAERHARPGRVAAVDRPRAAGADRASVGDRARTAPGLPVPAGGRRWTTRWRRTASRSPCGCATTGTPRPPVRGRHAPVPARRSQRGRRHRRRRAHRPRPDGAGDRRRPAHRARSSRFHGDVGRIGDRAFDTPLTDLERDDDGWARLRLRGPVGELELAVDEAWPWLQIYSGDALPDGPAAAQPGGGADDLPAERAGRRRRPASSSSPAATGRAPGRSAGRPA